MTTPNEVHDYSNGATSWDGTDFGTVDRYTGGYAFANKSHLDAINLAHGRIPFNGVKEVSRKWFYQSYKQDRKTYPGHPKPFVANYKYVSTAVYGATIFSKTTYDWRDSQFPNWKNTKRKDVIRAIF